MRQIRRKMMFTRLMKAMLAIVLAGLVGVSNSTAEAFWGHRPAVVTTGYAPAAYATTAYSLPTVPVTAAYVPAAPMVVSRPILAAAPGVAGPVISYCASPMC